MTETTAIYGGESPAMITGETSPAMRIVYFGGIGLAAAFAVEAIIATVVLGIMRNPHVILLAVPLVAFAVVITILILWYRNERDTLAPKWRRIIVALVLSYILFLIATNVAIFYNPVVPGAGCIPVYPGGNTYFNQATNDCVQCQPGFFCINFVSGHGACVNCTLLAEQLVEQFGEVPLPDLLLAEQ
eukprot:TRINITY_DN2309_c0_g1_i1.p1 TRINITY_DN2309_c0_g1~~TRINITY_DN2309_c0_g1_i1.p1  ORF type:complete len:187 (-),score=30.01 TRINITY_DN2309_c0_g1_i1:414-974(-)